MRIVTSLAATLVLLAGCVASDGHSAEPRAGSGSSVEFYGTLDGGIGHQSRSY